MASVLKVDLSEAVPPEVLRALHQPGRDVPKEETLSELILAVGGYRLVPVYEMSPEDIAVDKYGFAKEFKLFLRSGCDPQRAVATLLKSSLVGHAEPVSFEEPCEE